MRFDRIISSTLSLIQEVTKHKLEDSHWSDLLSSNDELKTAVQLMRDIKGKFPDKEIYIVGGVPRDIIMGNDVDDVDLATNVPFPELEQYYELHNISKNDSQPVYKINYGGHSLDLAQFREDLPGAKNRNDNVSTLTNDFEADTRRRDLTINSFGLNELGEIVDYQNGLDDLKNQLIKTVGKAHDRFVEDATRILRVARFAGKMGFVIHPDTRQAMIDLKHLIDDRNHISNESISKEFYKAAKSGRSLRKFLEHLIDTGILHTVLPEFMEMEDMMHELEHHPEADGKVLGHIMECLSASKYSDPVINLGVLFHDFGKAKTYELKGGRHTYHGHEGAGVPIVKGIFDRLKFGELSSDDKRSILIAVEKHMLIHNIDKLSIKVLTKLINDPSWEVLKSVAYCDAAARVGLFNENDFNKKIEEAEEKVKKLGNAEELKKRISQHINGNILMQWFPEFNDPKNKKMFGIVLPKIQDYVLNALNLGIELNPDIIKNKVKQILKM